MPSHDPDKFLADLAGQDRRLCYYPSCGNRSIWPIMKLDADIFIFSDYYARNRDARNRFWNLFKKNISLNLGPVTEVFSTVKTRVFRVGDKLGILFFQDNNEAIERIHSSGLKIHLFVGICDGCLEGGNYECVHNEPFISKVLSISENEFDYITDHSYMLQTQATAECRGGAPYFLSSFRHTSGCVFNLHSILVWVIPNERVEQESVNEELAILRMPDKERFYISQIKNSHATSDQSYPLFTLAPLRNRYHHSRLAHYQVYRVDLFSTSPMGRSDPLGSEHQEKR